MCPHAAWKGKRLCLKVVENPRKEIYHARPGVGYGGLCIENLETLPLRNKKYYLHGPQELTIHLRSEVLEYASKAMVRASQRL